VNLVRKEQMLCPSDKNDMIVVEYHQIELDYCTDCKGVWFDNAELDLLLKTLGLEKPRLLMDSMLSYPEIKSEEKRRKCPICGKTMKLINIGDNTVVIIDICPSGHGLWFDNGEVVQTIKHLAEDKHSKTGELKVFDFLGEVFQV
jgi:Zn-finger nucleic acid-binding protein